MKKVFKKSFIISIFVCIGLLGIKNIQAASSVPVATCQPIPGQGVSIQDCANANFPKGAPTTIGGWVSTILGQVYTIALVVMLAYLIWGSYRFMMAAGDPKAIAAARAHLTWAIAGMIIVFVAYWIYRVINELAFYVFQDI